MLTIMMTMVNISITSYKSLTIKRLAKAWARILATGLTVNSVAGNTLTTATLSSHKNVKISETWLEEVTQETW
jgi:hypothetical protein